MFFKDTSGRGDGQDSNKQGLKKNELDVGALAALALCLAVFCDAFHLGTGVRGVMGSRVRQRWTFAARQTVHARAPRMTWGFELCVGERVGGRRKEEKILTGVLRRPW